MISDHVFDERLNSIESSNKDSHIININYDINALLKTLNTKCEKSDNLIDKSSISSSEVENKSILYNKLSYIIILMIISLPISICDIYYAYNDNSCIKIYPKNLNINMKLYLLISGYSCVFILLISSYHVYCLTNKNDNKIANVCKIIQYILFVLSCMFSICWNIIGSLIYWGNLYNSYLCDVNISTYLFISLIVKIFGNLLSLNEINRN